MPPRTPDGLWIYLGSRDVVDIDRYGAQSDAMAKLKRCGAVGALPMIESVEGLRQPVDRIERVCAHLARASMSAILVSFPSVLGPLSRSKRHLRECREATGAAAQWDVEPKAIDGRVVHWTQAALDEVLEAEPDASITSTRVELRRLDARGRQLWLQLEQQTSTDTLDEVLSRWPDTVCITGTFDRAGDPRTLDEVRLDLERCRAQARRTGRHGVWSARSTSSDECDVLRPWALETWATSVAA